MARKKDPSSVTALEVFPKRLQELMEREPRTTQPQLAKALGIQRQTVSNYANGQSSPDWKTLAAIAAFFHVSADYLLGLSDDPQVTADSAAAAKYLRLSDYEVRQLSKLLQPTIWREIFQMLIRRHTLEKIVRHIEATRANMTRIEKMLNETSEYEARHIHRDLVDDLSDELMNISGYDNLLIKIKLYKQEAQKIMEENIDGNE